MKILRSILFSFLPALALPITSDAQQPKPFSIAAPLYHEIINTIPIKDLPTGTKLISRSRDVTVTEKAGQYEIEADFSTLDTAIFYTVNEGTEDTVGICKKTFLWLPEKDIIQPEVSLGDLKGKLVTPPLLREQRELKIAEGFRLVKATAYFSGPSFKNFRERTLFSTDLSPIKDLLDSCRGNDRVAFETVLKTASGRLLRGYKLVVNVGKVAQGTQPDFQYGYIYHFRSAADVFRAQKSIRVSRGCEFISATVYFTGAGFSKVVKTTLEGSAVQPINEFIQQCIPGTAVTFENIKIKKPSGEIITHDTWTYALY